MGDTVVTILAIVLAAVLMFVFPLMSVADRSDDVSQLSVQNSTTTFVDNIRSTGRITLAEYNRFAQEINATGNTYEIEMEVKILDENPGKKTAQTTYEKIGENITIQLCSFIFIPLFTFVTLLLYKKYSFFTNILPLC